MAIFVLNLDLQQKPKPASINIPLTAKADVAAIPAVAENGAGSIVTALQQGCDVVCLILQAFVVAGPAGVKS